MNKIFTKKNTMGFSLVEVMVTIAIIGTLAAIAVPVTLAQRTSSTVTAQKTDLINISTQLETVLTSWNGTPPAQTTITTSAGTWTATPSGQATAVSGPVSAGTSITGTMWTDGSYCIKATNTSGKTLIYRSDKDTVEETANCPTTALGSIGSIPASVATTLPAAPTGLVATSPSDGTITLSWTAVSGATSYTIKIPGMDAISTTSTAATMEGVNGGSNTVTVYAKNANGSGAGATTSVTVATGETGDSLPAGAVITTTQTTVPEGWLEADGRAVLRAAYPALYAAIGTTYGAGDGSTTFNLPNLKGRVIVGQDPAQTEFDTIGEVGGANTHTLTVAQMPIHTHIQDSHNHTQNAHTHTFSGTTAGDGGHRHNIRAEFGTGLNLNNGPPGQYNQLTTNTGYPFQSAYTQNDGNHTHTYSGTTAGTAATNNATTATNQNTGGGGAHNNLQPYFVMKYIIKTAASIMPSDALLDGRISTIENKLSGVTQAADINHTHTWGDISNAPGGYDMTAAGTIVQTSSPTLPSGWLLADGSAVSRTTYASLFAAIGTRYGAGDGSTTFNLPNLKGKSVKGFDSTQSDFNTLGATGGAKTHTLSVAQMPSHTHTQASHNHTQNAHNHGIYDPGHSHGDNADFTVGYIGGSGVSGIPSGWSSWGGRSPAHWYTIYGSYTGISINNATPTNNATTATNQNTGGGESFKILDPYITLYFMIKYTNANSSDTVFNNRLVTTENSIPSVNNSISTLQTQMSTHTHTWSSISNIPARLGPTSQTVTDWNTAVETGAYVSTNAANAPTSGAGVTYMGTVQSAGGNYIQQTVHEYSTDSSANTKTYRRDANDVSGSIVWTPWYRVFQSETEIKEVIAATPGGGGGDSMPAGSIVQIANTTAIPAGWELADGRTVSRDTYRTLFNAIGTTYGVGDGSTTFQLPDMRGKVVVGQDTGQTEFDTLGEVGGVKTHVLSVNEMPSHTHVQDAHNHTQNAHTHDMRRGNGGSARLEEISYSTGAVVQRSSTGLLGTTATNNPTTATNQNTGGGAAHNNLAPYIVLRYIIKTTATGPTDPALIARVAAEETQMAATAPIDNPVFSGDVLSSSQVGFLISGSGAWHPGGAWLDRGLWPNSAGTATATAVYNNGNAWNSGSGAFTAPQAGIYYFFASGYSPNNKGYGNRYAWSFYVNGVQKQISGGSTSNVDSPMSAASIALKLNAGDVVRLYMFSAVSQDLGNGPHQMYWGGYLLG